MSTRKSHIAKNPQLDLLNEFKARYRIANGELIGSVLLPADTSLCLEAMADIMRIFAEKTGVSVRVMADDIIAISEGRVT